MLKKVLVTAAVALTCVFTVNASNYYDTRPQIEFIQDGRSIEKRDMTDEELDAYHKIHEMEKQMDQFESPLESLEKQIEAKTEGMEEEIERMVENFEAGSSTIEQVRELAHQKASAAMDIKELVEQMKPFINDLKHKAKDIKKAAFEFKDTVTRNYGEGEIDSIRIIDDNGTHRIHINKMNLQLDDLDLDLDFDF